jgi:hypothetical protein
MALLPLTLLGWALVWAVLLATQPPHVAAVIPLLVLAAGFEAIHALHVGVERVGRYLQVFFETGSDGPQWESAAMRLGPGLPGAGVDPLFTPVFALAVAVDLLVPFARGPRPDVATATALAFVHAVLIVRLVRARQAASRQRAVDLETFRAIRIHLQAVPSPHEPGIGEPTR